MKRGFALLETIIVITFVAVSLLMLYGTFTNMIEKKERSLMYDDVSHIYELYYLKEYLLLEGIDDSSSIKKLTCDDFNYSSCSILFKEFSILELYLVPYGDEVDTNYSFYSYYQTLSNDEEYDYLLVARFLIEDRDNYASIGVNIHE